MTESREPAEVDDSLEQNLMLARRVVDAAQQEMLDKMRQRVPALRLGAVAGALGMLATAATYRMNVLLLERKLPPELASFVAAAVYGGRGRRRGDGRVPQVAGASRAAAHRHGPHGRGDPLRLRRLRRLRRRLTADDA